MRKAGSQTPSAFSTISPASPKKAMMQKAMMQARTATCLRSSADMPRVRDRKIGARPGGSRVTSSVTRAEVRYSRNIVELRHAAEPASLGVGAKFAERFSGSVTRSRRSNMAAMWEGSESE